MPERLVTHLRLYAVRFPVRNQKAYAGHLEPGSEVLYLAEVLIMRYNDLNMRREADPGRKIKLLKKGIE